MSGFPKIYVITSVDKLLTPPLSNKEAGLVSHTPPH